jgi:hypothetical protein
MKFATMGFVPPQWIGLRDDPENNRRIEHHQMLLNEITIQKGLIGNQPVVLSSTGLHGGAADARTIRLDRGKLTSSMGHSQRRKKFWAAST